jgi:hypothetical protein
VPVERHHVAEHVCCVLVVPVLPPPELQIFILFNNKNALNSMRSGQLRGQKTLSEWPIMYFARTKK